MRYSEWKIRIDLWIYRWNKLRLSEQITRTRTRVTGFAPLGDPMMVSVKGCQLAIRKEDAAYIQVVTA